MYWMDLKIHMTHLSLNGKDNALVRFYLEVCVSPHKGGRTNMAYSDSLPN